VTASNSTIVLSALAESENWVKEKSASHASFRTCQGMFRTVRGIKADEFRSTLNVLGHIRRFGLNFALAKSRGRREGGDGDWNQRSFVLSPH
jgi:hypothetical protein